MFDVRGVVGLFSSLRVLSCARALLFAGYAIYE